MRFSLREFLTVFGVTTVGLASLVYATPHLAISWMLLLAALLVRFGVRAVVVAGESRASAAGTVLAAVAYLSLLGVQDSSYAVGSQFEDEMSPWSGWLPTTAAVRVPYAWISETRSFYEDDSGNRYKQVPPGAVDQSLSVSMGFNPPASSVTTVTRRWRPDAKEFMTVAHCLWTLMFGYLGGKYAVWVYSRRGGHATEAASDSH